MSGSRFLSYLARQKDIMISDEKASLCALGRIFGFKPGIALALISHFGSARAVFDMIDEEKRHLLGPGSRYAEELCTQSLDQAYNQLKELQGSGIYFVGWTEEHYPALLKECEDAPAGLYIRSETPVHDLWKPKDKIAIIGTRDISPYGREWCERIVNAFAGTGAGPMIVSGLALGTDICAHRKALENGLPTIGVMATGPESIYPWRNEGVARKMISTPGCALVTDYPPGTAPLAIHFLRRNRIIAGLSQATILIESRIKGGGMNTSRMAFSYNRDSYALPGRIDDAISQGCNLLIRNKMAEPIISMQDLIDSIGMRYRPVRSGISDRDRLEAVYGNHNDPSWIDTMCNILSLVRNNRNITIEEIASATALPYNKAACLCNTMESDDILSIDLLQRCSINADFS